MKNKSFLKKTEHCLGIIVNVFAILGISVLGGKSLIKDESERYLSEEETRIFEEESVFLTNSDYENDSLNIRNTQSNQEQGQDENLNKEYENTDTNNSEIDEESEESNNKSVTPFVTSTPKSDTVINVHLSNWNEEDKDIFGNNYTGSNTFKLSVYNMILAMGGGADDITAEVHFPLGENFDDIWIIDFLVMQDMLGNGSYANITILSGEEELYPTFTITSDTTDEYKYEVNLSGIRDLIIRYNCHAVDSGFCGGMIVNEL